MPTTVNDPYIGPDGQVHTDRTRIVSDEEMNAAARAAALEAAIETLDGYVTTALTREGQARNTPALRSGTAWTQAQRVQILDTIGDLCHAVAVLSRDMKWVVQELRDKTDPPDAAV